MAEQAESRLATKIRSNFVPLSIAFGIFVFLVLLPQLVFYRGLISALAEWQYDWFGNYFPILTVAIPVLLLTLIFLVILWLVLQLRRNRLARDPIVSVTRQLHRARARTRLTMRSFQFLTGLALLGGIISLILMALLPNEEGERQIIDVGSLPFAEPREGAAQLNGTLDWQNLSTFKRNLVLASQRTYYVPIVSRVAERKSTRYFVQVFRPEFVLPRNRMPGRTPEWDKLLERGRITPTRDGPGNNVQGILRQEGLPKEIVRLYRKAGIEVHPDHYILYRNADDMRWPYWTAAIQFFLLAFAAALLSLFQRRQLKRLDRGMANASNG